MREDQFRRELELEKERAKIEERTTQAQIVAERMREVRIYSYVKSELPLSVRVGTTITTNCFIIVVWECWVGTTQVSLFRLTWVVAPHRVTS